MRRQQGRSCLASESRHCRGLLYTVSAAADHHACGLTPSAGGCLRVPCWAGKIHMHRHALTSRHGQTEPAPSGRALKADGMLQKSKQEGQDGRLFVRDILALELAFYGS